MTPEDKLRIISNFLIRVKQVRERPIKVLTGFPEIEEETYKYLDKIIKILETKKRLLSHSGDN